MNDNLIDIPEGYKYDFKMMTIQEASEYLHIPLNTLYKMYSKLPHWKNGHRIMFCKYQLNKWLIAQMRNNVN